MIAVIGITYRSVGVIVRCLILKQPDCMPLIVEAAKHSETAIRRRLQRYSVSFEHDGLLRKCHGNV